MSRIEQITAEATTYLKTHLLTVGSEPSLQERIEDPKFVIVYHAPALILVFAREEGAQAAQDCCLVAQSLMLAARVPALVLAGSVWRVLG